jgi:hypothetical protein
MHVESRLLARPIGDTSPRVDHRRRQPETSDRRLASGMRLALALHTGPTMKTSVKRSKLTLNTETIQSLTTVVLDEVQGGKNNVTFNFCSQPCEVTVKERSWCVCNG